MKAANRSIPNDVNPTRTYETPYPAFGLLLGGPMVVVGSAVALFLTLGLVDATRFSRELGPMAGWVTGVLMACVGLVIIFKGLGTAGIQIGPSGISRVSKISGLPRAVILASEVIHIMVEPPRSGLWSGQGRFVVSINTGSPGASGGTVRFHLRDSKPSPSLHAHLQDVFGTKLVAKSVQMG